MTRNRKPLLVSSKGEILKDGIEVIDNRTADVRLLEWEELLPWQQEDTHFIETGYRPASGSLGKCFQSLTYLHNETVNIYSHIIGSLIFFLLPIYLYMNGNPPRYEIARTGDIVVCALYFWSVGTCFFFSALFHTTSNHSPEICHLGICLDFQGVVLLMWGAGIPMIYYTFPCHQPFQIFYWTLLTLSTALLRTNPHFSTNFGRPLRAATFCCLALSTLIPVLHGILEFGWEMQNQRFGMQSILLTLGFNGVGALVYVLKIPERYFRRTFDIYGSSHQVLHIMVIFAGLAYSRAVLGALNFANGEESRLGGC